MTKQEQTKTFYHQYDAGRGLYLALQECQSAGYKADFLPQLADRRIQVPAEDPLWQQGYDTLSLKATAKTSQGSKVEIICHKPHYFSRPKNIQTALLNVVNGAGIIPEKEIQKYLKQEDGKTVIVIPEEKKKQAQFGEITFELALENPFFMASLGNDETRAKAYLKKFGEVRNKETIRVYDIDDAENTGRLLVLGGDVGSDVLGGICYVNCGGRFFGVRCGGRELKVPVGDAVKTQVSPLESLLGKGNDVGNGLIVIRQDQISPEAYQLLIKKN